MSYNISRLFPKLLASVIPFSLAITVSAQVSPTDLNLDTGIKPYETYDRAQENVNIASGNLEVEIPLVHLPGRNGHGFDLKLVYNSQNWTPVASPNSFINGNVQTPDPGSEYIAWSYAQPGTNGTSIGSTGWQLNIPVLYATGVNTPPGCLTATNGCAGVQNYTQSSQYTNFYLVMGDGRKYQFPYASFLNWQTTFTQGSANENTSGQTPFTQPNPSEDFLIDFDGNQKYLGSYGDGVMLDLTNAANGTGMAVVRFPDGSQLLFDITGAFPQPVITSSGTPAATANIQTIGIAATSFVDSNGNVTSFGGTTITSSTGASISNLSVAQLGVSPGQGTITYNNSNGQPETITLNTSSFPNVVPTWQTPTVGESGIVSISSQSLRNMLSSVVLPDGLSYTFQYNAYGELTEITYPSGGYTRYTYAAEPNGNSYQWTSANSGGADQRRVVEKDTCSGQAVSAGAIVQSAYAGSTTPSSTCPVAEETTTYNGGQVVDPLGNETDYWFGGDACGNPPAGPFVNFGENGMLMEYGRWIYQGRASSGKLLRTVYSGYLSGCEPFKTIEMAILPNGNWRETTWSYDTTPNVYFTPAVNDHGTMTQSLASAETHNMHEEIEYGFGPGPAPTTFTTSPNLPLLRETVNCYLGATTCFYGDAPVSGSVYLQAPVYILNRLAQQKVYDGSNGEVALSNYAYDYYAGEISASNAIQHGTSLNSYGTSYITRGNITGVSKLDLKGGYGDTKFYYYDDAGNVLTMQDGITTTTYDYTDAWNNSACAPSSGLAAAFPRTITNALGEASEYSWNSCTGTMAAVIDPNLALTQFAYDSMDRKIQAQYPEGGSTCLQYSDAENSVCPSIPGSGAELPITIGVTQGVNSGTNETNIITLDGLSRVVQTELYSDPQGPDYVTTQYDATGNIANVSNPYRSTSDSTYGVTSYQYDALHRKVFQTQQDGATIQWCYDGIQVNSLQSSSLCSPDWGSQATLGSWVNIQDENGNQWQDTTDALGRLVKVIEPSATSPAPSMETDYAYNGLDDLTSVTQYGGPSGSPAPNGPITRSFSYDGLSRLIQTYNPESGWTCYGTTGGAPPNGTNCTSGTAAYDPSGNLLAKTDALGVVTTYNYDAANRLLSKSYSDGTPSACFEYGEPGQNSVANGIGRLIAEWTQNGACPSITQPPPPGSPAKSTPPPSIANLTERTIGAYDSMGRVLIDNQCFNSGGCGTNYPQFFNTFNYSYDLLGNETGFNSGSMGGQLSFVSAYNGANRLSSLTGSQTPGGGQTALYTPTGYTPGGALTDAQIGLGTTPGITFHRDYNSRLWATDEKDTGPTAPGSATVSLAGAEQMAEYSDGFVTFSGADQAGDTGLITVSVAGTPYAVPYGSSSTPSTLASYLASIMTCGSGASDPVEGVAIGATTYITSCTAGANTSYVLSATSMSSGYEVSFSETGGGGTSGAFAVLINGDGGPEVSWSSTSTPATLAASLTASIGSCSTSGNKIGAIQVGGNVYINGCTSGALTSLQTNLLGCSCSSTNLQSFSITSSAIDSPSFTAETSGSTMAPVTTPTPTGSGYEVSIPGSPNNTTGAIGVFLYGPSYRGPISLDWTTTSTPASLVASIASAIGSCSNPNNSVGATLEGSDVYIMGCRPGALTSVAVSILGCGCTETQYDSFAPTVTNSAYIVDFAEAASGADGAFAVQISATSSSGTTSLPAPGAEVEWTSTSTPASLAQSLAAKLGSCSTPGTLMSGTAVGDLVYLTGCQAGTTYSVSTSLLGCNCTENIGPLFSIALANAEDIGIIPGPLYDSGTVALTVNGKQIASAAYVQGSTPASIASALASNSSGNGVATVTASGASLTLTALDGGSSSDYSYSLAASSSSPSTFATPSFAGAPASGTLAGAGGTGPLYNWSIGSNFAPNGNVMAMTDSVMGSWTYTYDDLNRIASATASCPPGEGSGQMTLSWMIDPFGNRSSQTASSTGGCNASAAQPVLAINVHNQVSGWTYDADGRVTNDGRNTYAYDAEGRVKLLNGTTAYIYDAEGRRVGKGTFSGVQLDETNFYLLGLGGEQVTEYAGGNWAHSNVWADGKLIGTYEGPGGTDSTPGYHFHLTDWLGTQRMQTTASGSPEETCFSYPFGDGLNCTGSDATEHHFTSKARDAESGNDYFGARYFGSSMGRFISPDPLLANAPRLVNPQRWNMYAYAVNNPLLFTDPDGRDAATVTFTTEVGGLGHDGLLSVHSDGSVTFAEYGPRGGHKPWGIGNVTTLSSSNGQLPALKFNANGTPTPQSLSAVKNTLAKAELVSPNSIKIAYFKTSSSETAALDQYIAAWVAASKTGRLRYLVTGANCAMFCQGGMKAAGLSDFHGTLPIPNVLALDWWWASSQDTAQKPLREKVTHEICDANGRNCH